MTSLLFDAIDLCLNITVSKIKAPDEGSSHISFTSRLIETNVIKYQQNNASGNEQFSLAGGISVPINNVNDSDQTISMKV